MPRRSTRSCWVERWRPPPLHWRGAGAARSATRRSTTRWLRRSPPTRPPSHRAETCRPALAAAVHAAAGGMRSTRRLVARRGLAMRLGTRSAAPSIRVPSRATSCSERCSSSGREPAPLHRARAARMTDLEQDVQIASLQREVRRIGSDAQREADAMFAQYQLSQLLASGSPPEELAATVATEVRRLARASLVGLWIAELGNDRAAAGRGRRRTPRSCRRSSRTRRRHARGPPPARGHCSSWPTTASWVSSSSARRRGVPSTTKVSGSCVSRGTSWPSRFGAAGLRRALDDERAELTAIVEGATDAILQVDDGCRVVRINPAGLALLGRTNAEVLGRPCWDVLGCAESVGRGRPTSRAACPLAEVLRTRVAGALPGVGRAHDGWPRDPGRWQLFPGRGRRRGQPACHGDPARHRCGPGARRGCRESFVVTVSHELRSTHSHWSRAMPKRCATWTCRPRTRATRSSGSMSWPSGSARSSTTSSTLRSCRPTHRSWSGARWPSPG